jgi:hypothetical protein
VSDKKRAEEAIKKALLKTETAKKFKKGVKKELDKKKRQVENSTGLDFKKLSKAAAVVRTLASGKLKAKKNLSKDSSISGEIDVKNKSVKVNYNKSF